MTKIFLTTLISLFTLTASSQIMVTSSMSAPADGEEWSVDNLTDNMGLGYTMDKFTVGVMMNNDNYDLFGRYSFNDNLYISGLITEDEDMSLGLGYSLQLYDKFYLEPSYMMDMSDDSEDNEGELKLSLTYKF